MILLEMYDVQRVAYCNHGFVKLRQDRGLLVWYILERAGRCLIMPLAYAVGGSALSCNRADPPTEVSVTIIVFCPIN